MSAVFPMCLRTTRGLLRLRNRAEGACSPAVLDLVRTLSTDKPPAGNSSATGGLAQAILQTKLQQQSQVGTDNLLMGARFVYRRGGRG
ncbi:Mitochondrial import inner membrane translocase subunit TIM50 [Dissostichus eleginoides]|uniref:Mitochondrial import inner membrane translocase subunit TIM50 n=1 Tax=Dissostichus eleginoides TaxID=100907 RepID=A0AAD9CI51_DISEL|nr:Mitochondrial import inner membrane translocase subunit TIM50 [Dissostichus eleginoides]